MKKFRHIKTFEAFTADLPPSDNIENVIQYQKQDTSKSDTIPFSDAMRQYKPTEKTLETLKSLNLVEGKLYNCIFGESDTSLVGRLIHNKNNYQLDFRDLSTTISRYIQVHNLENNYKLRIFNSNRLKHLLKIKDGTIFVSFEPHEEGSYVIYIDTDGNPQFTNITDQLTEPVQDNR